MSMRRVAGTIVFPPDAQPLGDAHVLIELRDVSLQDAPSTVLARQELARQSVRPGLELAFELMAPEAMTARSLALRVQVDRPASRGPAAPALLTTAVWPVPARGDALQLRIGLQQL